MAIHLPITDKAQEEARELMVTSKNLLAPSSGDPIVTPSQDMILGCYYVTAMDSEAKGSGQLFSSITDVSAAYDAGAITIKSAVKVRVNGEVIETCLGRLQFNEITPDDIDFINETVGKSVLKTVLADSFERLGSEITAAFVNRIMTFGYDSATISGLSISKEDMVMPEIKKELLEQGTDKVKAILKAHWN